MNDAITPFPTRSPFQRLAAMHQHVAEGAGAPWPESIVRDLDAWVRKIADGEVRPTRGKAFRLPRARGGPGLDALAEDAVQDVLIRLLLRSELPFNLIVETEGFERLADPKVALDPFGVDAPLLRSADLRLDGYVRSMLGNAYVSLLRKRGGEEPLDEGVVGTAHDGSAELATQWNALAQPFRELVTAAREGLSRDDYRENFDRGVGELTALFAGETTMEALIVREISASHPEGDAPTTEPARARNRIYKRHQRVRDLLRGELQCVNPGESALADSVENLERLIDEAFTRCQRAVPRNVIDRKTPHQDATP